MYQYNAKVINVVDGDTLDLDIDLGFKVHFTTRVRLLGVDTPEMKIKEQQVKAKQVKAIVEEELLNKTVLVDSRSKDKYGRYLVVIYLQDGSVYNNSLIERNLVKEGSKWNTGV